MSHSQLTVSPFLFFFFSQSKLTKLNHEHRDLKEKLKEERKQIEELWKAKTELEDERRLQDRAVEQLQRKVRGGPGLFIGPYGKIQPDFWSQMRPEILSFITLKPHEINRNSWCFLCLDSLLQTD